MCDCMCVATKCLCVEHVNRLFPLNPSFPTSFHCTKHNTKNVHEFAIICSHPKRLPSSMISSKSILTDINCVCERAATVIRCSLRSQHINCCTHTRKQTKHRFVHIHLAELLQHFFNLLFIHITAQHGKGVVILIEATFRSHIVLCLCVLNKSSHFTKKKQKISQTNKRLFAK